MRCLGRSAALEKSSTLEGLYHRGNRLLTRRAVDEYFFKSIPYQTDQVLDLF